MFVLRDVGAPACPQHALVVMGPGVPGCVKSRVSRGSAELFSQLLFPTKVASAIRFRIDKTEKDVLPANWTTDFLHSMERWYPGRRGLSAQSPTLVEYWIARPSPAMTVESVARAIHVLAIGLCKQFPP